MSDDPVAIEIHALRQAVATLNTNLAVNTEANKGLQRSMDRLRETAVTRVEHRAIVEDVAELKTAVDNRATHKELEDVKKGVERNDLRWNRVLWGIATVVGLALLGTVVVQGGTQWASSISHVVSIVSWSAHSSSW